MSADNTPQNPGRREFLGHALKLGAGSMLLARATPARAAAASGGAAPSMSDPPARVYIDADGSGLKAAHGRGDRFSAGAIRVDLGPAPHGFTVSVACASGTLNRVVLRWDLSFPAGTRFLGDHWERGYGDLEWRGFQPERVMPWYVAAHAPSGATFMAGVKTQPSALCFWMADEQGLSLWLDFRNGGNPCVPGDREIAAAEVITLTTSTEELPHLALRRFCGLLSPNPRLAAAPICGNNNWYYAYGRDFDAAAMVRDATYLAELASGHPVRPYCVVDAGWTPGGVCPGGPWTAGDPTRFPDMPGLAARMKSLGVRPGIWMRPTALSVVDNPRRLRAGPCPADEKALDLTLPENLAQIHEDVARVRGWGFELIKHDFSTFDLFGRWGMQMGAEITDGGWNFSDRTLTNAEIILRLYRTLREAAGEAVLLGCNTMGHLGAGLFEIQRAGDDTSGRVWERTRRMGINTLAYRLCQHGTFFQLDPDCVAHTAATPWELDQQFLDLVARSGCPLFVSVDPRTVTTEQTTAFRAAMQMALSGGNAKETEPIDWMNSTCPQTWRFGDTRKTYRWMEATGANPFRA
ncbi:MAG TPA: hypothetical protein VHD32_17680 [Candidatus Didemnitutus sp.]|nr:hypothetical protein [Candidatus Didemnitutus sp.]